MDEETESVDVIVVGLGVAGESLAGQLAEAGLDVVGIEAQLVGGECPYWACVPSKMMIRAANLLAEANRIPGIAGAASVTPSWEPVARRIREEATDSWDDTAAVERLSDQGCRVVKGRAQILAPRQVEVPGEGRFEARRALVLATGTSARVPSIPGLAGTPYWTNHEAMEAAELPKSLLIIGAGAIGSEIGQAWGRFGVEVTIIDPGDVPLSKEEPEASALVASTLESEGVRLRLGTEIRAVSHAGGEFAVELSDGAVERGQRLLVATGRRPTLDADTWRRLGLEGEPGYVRVDDQLKVADGLWAIGDVTGRGAFTHVGTYQADIAAAAILGAPIAGASYHALPRVTFTDPEIGAVGWTEQQARDEGIDVAAGLARIPETSRGWIHAAGNEGFIKLVVDADTDVLVGATSAGPNGGEVLGALAVAVHARLKVSRLETMIYAYPTFHRGILDAVRDLRARLDDLR